MPRDDLRRLTPDDLAALTNRGTVKRAQRELESGEVSGELDEAADGTVVAKWSDAVVCTLPGGKTVSDARCTCPATELCRHAVRTVLAYQARATAVAPELAERVARGGGGQAFRAFPGAPGFLRDSAGPGWALVGDAGYFKDPLTAHGITDALRDAELVARAVIGRDLPGYQAVRDGLVKGLFAVTDRIASFQWDLEEAKVLHLALSREMNEEVRLLTNLHAPAGLVG